MKQTLYRFRDGRGECLEVAAKGMTVTWRVVPLGVHTATVKTRVEMADSAETAEELAESILSTHRAAGFTELTKDQLHASLAGIEPYRRWYALTVATLPEYFAYLDAGELVDAFAARVVSIDHADNRIDLEGGLVLRFGASLGTVAEEPPMVRPYWERHSIIWAERERFGIILGQDIGPPEGDSELEGSGFTATQWVMSRGTEQYWFIDQDGSLRLFDLDGGVGEPVESSLGRLWLELVLDLIG